MTNCIGHNRKISRSILFLVAVATLGIPYIAFGAGRAGGNPGGFNISTPPSHGTPSRGFHRGRFFGSDNFAEPEITIIQVQPQPASTLDSEKADKKRTYVPPHWVDGGYGVEILEPGQWIETESDVNRRR